MEKVHHEYNYFGLERTNIGSAKAVSPGKHVIKYEFVFEGTKPGSGGKCLLYIDDQKVSEGEIPKTQPFLFSADEGVDVGMDGETAVSNDYKQGDNKFTGKIHKITIDTSPSGLSATDDKKLSETAKTDSGKSRLKPAKKGIAKKPLILLPIIIEKQDEIVKKVFSDAFDFFF
jgi:arylsulfatase